MARDEERRARAQEPPVVGSLPDVPGITVAMQLTPELGMHMRGLADALLVNDFPGATIGRPSARCWRRPSPRRTTASSAWTRTAHSRQSFSSARGDRWRSRRSRSIKVGETDALEPRMQALVRIAHVVGRDPLSLTAAETQAASDAGASDGDVQLAVLIAAGFSMYNRMVDGFRAMTPPVVEAHHESARRIAEQGYSTPGVPAAATS